MVNYSLLGIFKGSQNMHVLVSRVGIVGIIHGC